MLATEEFAFIEQAIPNVEDSKSKTHTKIAYCSLKLAEDDSRSKLSDEVIKEKHPEVRIIYDGTREINDINSEWFEFLGKGAGKVKCNNPLAEKKCLDFTNRY